MIRKQAVALFVLVVALAAGRADAHAQALDAAFAQSFVGAWELTLATPDGRVPLMLLIDEQDGVVSVRMGRDPERAGPPIPNVARTGDSLTLRFEMSYQGMDMPVQIDAQRDGEALQTEWTFAEGMYQTSARATRS